MVRTNEIGRPGGNLDRLRRTSVYWRFMSRRVFTVFLILANGCSSAPSTANQMAPTPPAVQVRPQESPKPVALPAPLPVSDDGIAARINNEILTWKDVRDALKEIKAADLTPELLKSK